MNSPGCLCFSFHWLTGKRPFSAPPQTDTTAAMLIGYARVSTSDQKLNLQRDALKAAGCTRIFTDRGVSGATNQRPGLARALAFLKPGYTLIVWKLDRLGRSPALSVSIGSDSERKCTPRFPIS